ncbi:PIN domain-containing protein [Bradyrhizobium sp. 168]|nr:PIN domain-containing protein [Bradyrhizobium sp. 168]
MSTFVDSTVWFAAAAKRDRNNELAKSILSSTEGWVLTDHVLAETWQLLRAHFGAKVAEKFWKRLRDTGVRVATLTADDLEVLRRSKPAKSFLWSIAPASPSWSAARSPGRQRSIRSSRNIDTGAISRTDFTSFGQVTAKPSAR